MIALLIRGQLVLCFINLPSAVDTLLVISVSTFFPETWPTVVLEVLLFITLFGEILPLDLRLTTPFGLPEIPPYLANPEFFRKNGLALEPDCILNSLIESLVSCPIKPIILWVCSSLFEIWPKRY